MTAVRRVSANGIQLHTELQGEGSAPPLVFLHGWLRSSHEWRHLFGPLSTVSPCIALDLPGFGQSDIPDAAYDLPFFRDTVIGALDALGLDRVRLVGHGLGGTVAFAIALQQPSRVDGVVAASPTVHPTPRAGLRARALVRSPLGQVYFKHLLNKTRLREMLLGTHYHEPLRVTDEVMQPILTWLDRPGARDVAWKALCTDLDTGLSGAIGGLTVPSAVIWGYVDRIHPVDMGKQLEREVDCIALKQIPNVGYMAVEERPSSVARYLTDHFKLPMPSDVWDGQPYPEEGNYDA